MDGSLTKFAVHLWDGFDMLVKNNENEIKICKEISKFVVKKQEQEETFSKNLRKIVLKEGQGCQPTVRFVWEGILQQTTNQAVLHEKIAKLLGEKVIVPLDAFIKQDKLQHKQLFDKGTALINDFKNIIDTYQKTKANYKKCGLEMSAAKNLLEKSKGDAKMNPKKFQELEKDAQKKTLISEQAENSFQKKVDETNQWLSQYYGEKMPRILIEFEKVQRMRSRVLEKNFATYLQVLFEIPPTIENQLIEVQTILNNVNEEEDLEAFIIARRTGKELPKPFSFEFWYQESGSVPPPSNIVFGFYDSSATLGKIQPKAPPPKPKSMLGGGGGGGGGGNNSSPSINRNDSNPSESKSVYSNLHSIGMQVQNMQSVPQTDPNNVEYHDLDQFMGLGGPTTSEATQFYSSVKHIGLAHDQNSTHRKTMEDAHIILDNFGGVPQQGFFAIYDGHMGRGCVDFLAAYFHENLLHALQMSDPLTALRNTFLQTDEQISQYRQQSNIGNSGSTAVTVLVQNKSNSKYIHVANVGDTRGVLIRNGNALQITKEHKATEETELNRLKQLGVFVSQGKVAGILSVSRAFGDLDLKQWINAEPSLQTITAGPNDSHIILACDGVWDVLSSQEVAAFVVDCVKKGNKNPQNIAHYIVEWAKRKDQLTTFRS